MLHLSGVCRMPPNYYFFQMAHDKVFGIRCKEVTVLNQVKLRWDDKTEAPGPIADPFCDRAISWKNMSADRRATFKQPPRHVIDATLSQEVRRNKVCRCETTCITCSSGTQTHITFHRRWRSKNACDTSLLHQKMLFNAYRIFRDGRGVWRVNAILIYLPA